VKVKTYPKVAFDEKHYLFVSDQHLILADDIKPSLEFGLHPFLILVGSGPCGGTWRRKSGDQTFWIGVNEVILKLA
jgi:hypothetical protein